MNQDGVDFWLAILGDHGPMVGLGIKAIGDVPDEDFEAALDRLDMEATLGPMRNPTAYIGGGRFDNLRITQDLIRKARALAKAHREMLEGWHSDLPEAGPSAW